MCKERNGRVIYLYVKNNEKLSEGGCNCRRILHASNPPLNRIVLTDAFNAYIVSLTIKTLFDKL